MSLHPAPIDPVPEQTVRVARAAFPKGNPSVTLRDQFGTIFHDADFVDLYSHEGQPGLSPWRLALVTIMQFRGEEEEEENSERALLVTTDTRSSAPVANERKENSPSTQVPTAKSDKSPVALGTEHRAPWLDYVDPNF